MSWDTIRPLILEKLDAIEGIGQTHDYIRHTRFWSEFFARHVDKGRVNTWEFTRTAMASEFDSLGDRQVVGCQFRQTHRINIIGRGAVSEKPEEGTEKDFQDLTDRVVDAFRADTLLGGRLYIPDPPEIQTVGHQNYGSVLVHQAIITLSATERVGSL